jgi:hypothetical protein
MPFKNKKKNRKYQRDWARKKNGYPRKLGRHKTGKIFICEICGKNVYRSVGRYKVSKVCSMKCHGVRMKKLGWSSMKGSNHWNWKGGKRVRKDGYVMIFAPEHPRAINGEYLEHRIVMEKYLGRRLEGKCLKDREVVHHIDGNRQNNSINNLMLFPNNTAHLNYERQNKK